jgi:predicted RNA-binding protein YlxR (DUF448 family)
VRLVARDGYAVVDPDATLPGRGAHLHRDPVCLERAMRRRALARALRAPVAVPAETVEWMTEWPRSASTR